MVAEVGNTLDRVGDQIAATGAQLAQACTDAASATREGVVLTREAPPTARTARTLQQQLDEEDARLRERQSKAPVPVHVELWTWLKDTFTHIVSAHRTGVLCRFTPRTVHTLRHPHSPRVAEAEGHQPLPGPEGQGRVQQGSGGRVLDRPDPSVPPDSEGEPRRLRAAAQGHAHPQPAEAALRLLHVERPRVLVWRRGDGAPPSRCPLASPCTFARRRSPPSALRTFVMQVFSLLFGEPLLSALLAVVAGYCIAYFLFWIFVHSGDTW